MLKTKLHFEQIPVEDVLKTATRPILRGHGISRYYNPATIVRKNERAEKEPWRELCELAAVEHDPQRLHELVREIIRMEAKEQRSEQPSSSADSMTQTAGPA